MRRTGFLLLLLLLFAAVPSVEAGITIQDIRTPAQPVEPVSGEGTLEVDYEVTCDVLWDPTSSSKEITADLDLPDGFSAAGTITQTLDNSGCQTPESESLNGTFTFGISADRTVIGLEAQSSAITLSVGASPYGLAEADNDTKSFDLTAGFFGLLAAQTSTPVVETKGGVVDVNVTITNMGNALTQVVFHYAEVGNATPGVTITLPDPVILDTPLRGEDAEATNMTVTVRVEGVPRGKETAIQFRAMPHAPEGNNATGPAVDVNIVVKNVAKANNGIPATPLPFVMLAGLAVVALARRRA